MNNYDRIDDCRPQDKQNNFLKLFDKTKIFCPGPTPLAADVLASNDDQIYHRSENFKLLLKDCRNKLTNVFNCHPKYKPLILTSSGTGAMEAAILHFCDLDDQVVVLNAGKFGGRWVELARQYQLDVKELVIEWGQTCSTDELIDFIKKQCTNPKAIFFQGCETSTGVYHDIKNISHAIKNNFCDMYIIVDAISTLGAHYVNMQSWQIDCVLSGSQKGFGVSPGLSFIALSERALQIKSSRQKYYFDLHKEFTCQEKNLTRWTPGISLIQDLQKAVNYWHKIGFDNIIHRHSLVAQSVRVSLKSAGIELLAKSPANSLTSFYIPEKIIKKQINFSNYIETHYGCLFAGGQERLKNKIVRFSHLGFFQIGEVIAAMSALQMALKDLGVNLNTSLTESLLECLSK